MGRKSTIHIDKDGVRWKVCPKCGEYFPLPADGSDRSYCPSCATKYQKARVTKLARMRRRINAIERLEERMSRQSQYATLTNSAINVLTSGSVNDLLKLGETRTAKGRRSRT